jgi:hypothetical protein
MTIMYEQYGEEICGLHVLNNVLVILNNIWMCVEGTCSRREEERGEKRENVCVVWDMEEERRTMWPAVWPSLVKRPCGGDTLATYPTCDA